jgi:hypothetical protein
MGVFATNIHRALETLKSDNGKKVVGALRIYGELVLGGAKPHALKPTMAEQQAEYAALQNKKSA